MGGLLASCASSGELSGGPKDVTPPTLMAQESSEPEILNYDGEPLQFVFSEYISLENKKQIDISPPLNYIPEYTVRGKKLKVKFSDKEELKDDVTYSIKFNNAVVDFTEGNPTKDLTYVFSTGDKIDKGELSGLLSYAQDIEANDEDVLIMLYPSDQDSMIAQERPLYYTKVDESGGFKIDHIKSGDYSIYALSDKNFNYKYDLPQERIGFSENRVSVSEDSTAVKDLLIFLPKQEFQLVSSEDDRYGYIDMEFNQVPERIPSITVIDEAMEIYPVWNKEKLKIYYNDTISRVKLAVLGDTIQFKLPEQDSSLYKGALKIISTDRSVKEDSEIGITLAAPASNIHKEGISLLDTIQDRQLDYTSRVEGDKVYFSPQEMSDKFILKMDSAAIVDIYGKAIDSVEVNIKVIPREELASVLFTTVNTEDFSYVLKVQLDEDLIYRDVITKESGVSIGDLIEGVYTIELIEDRDLDGEWSTGDYWTQKQPEKSIKLEVEIREKDNSFVIDWEAGKLQSKEELFDKKSKEEKQ